MGSGSSGHASGSILSVSGIRFADTGRLAKEFMNQRPKSLVAPTGRVSTPDSSGVNTDMPRNSDRPSWSTKSAVADEGRRSESARTSFPTWSAIGQQGHAVQFYTDDTVLLDVLSGYIGTALVTGDAAVVIATPAHREGLERSLAARGLDVEISRRQGRYVPLDAAETLGKILDGGWPEGERVVEVLGGALDRAAAAVGEDRPRIAVFGEMVGLFWAAGKPRAAIRLEELWNDLANTRSFSLCCAYPMNEFATHADAAPFLKICAQHSHVFPAERRRRRTESLRPARDNPPQLPSRVQ